MKKRKLLTLLLLSCFIFIFALFYENNHYFNDLDYEKKKDWLLSVAYTSLDREFILPSGSKLREKEVCQFDMPEIGVWTVKGTINYSLTKSDRFYIKVKVDNNRSPDGAYVYQVLTIKLGDEIKTIENTENFKE